MTWRYGYGEVRYLGLLRDVFSSEAKYGSKIFSTALSFIAAASDRTPSLPSSMPIAGDIDELAHQLHARAEHAAGDARLLRDVEDHLVKVDRS